MDLWRPNYSRENGEPSEDTREECPGCSPTTIREVAIATVMDGATLADVLNALGDRGPTHQLEMAHAYFSEWRERAPFLADSWQVQAAATRENGARDVEGVPRELEGVDTASAKKVKKWSGSERPPTE